MGFFGENVDINELKKELINKSVIKASPEYLEYFESLDSRGKVRQAIYNTFTIERIEQYKKWGDQRHDLQFWYIILMEEIGEVAKAILEDRGEECNKKRIGKELVQSGAVIVAILEYMQTGHTTVV